MVVPPEYVLEPLNTVEPTPVKVRAPDPENTPERVA
jgi:hypothetical protein